MKILLVPAKNIICQICVVLLLISIIVSCSLYWAKSDIGNKINKAPTVELGSPQTLILPQLSIDITPSISDDNLPGIDTLSYAWGIQYSDGNVTISDPSSCNITVTFDKPGVYVLLLTVSDGELSSEDDITIYVVEDTLGTEYSVGPGQPLSSLSQVPWTELNPGDTVRIYYREEPYRERICLNLRGREDARITITGMKGPNGELPVISGENAICDSQFKDFFVLGDSNNGYEQYQLILIDKSRTDGNTHEPGYITIENLKITRGYPDYTFTNVDGVSGINYSTFTSGIRINRGEHIKIRGCEFTENSLGIFLRELPEDYAIPNDIIIEGCYFHYNGVVGSHFEHNIYIQGINVTVQYCWFDQLRPGGTGSTIKSRAAGTVIRYNMIKSSTRAIDIVDVEEGINIIYNHPAYSKTYIYGNVIENFVNPDSEYPFAANMIHYGYDNNIDTSRRGILYFYNNTVSIICNRSDWWWTNLFQPSTEDENVVILNNIIHVQPRTYEAIPTNFSIATQSGTVSLNGTNWITSGWTSYRENYGFSGSVTVTGTVLEGTDPGFIDEFATNYYLASSSPCIDQSSTLPTDITNKYDLSLEYVPLTSYKQKVVTGSGIDLGAFD